MESKKLKRVTIPTEKGDKSMLFSPINDAEVDVCCLVCPYCNVCSELRDPRNLNNPNTSFLDCCASLTEEKEIEESEEVKVIENNLNHFVPCRGSLEKLYTELGCKNIAKDLLDKNPLVRLAEVIDCVCPGWCDLYTKEHTKCDGTNKMCILNSIISKRKHE